MKTGIEMIADERKRQIEVEGYSEQHDSQHKASELIYAAIAYVESAKVGVNCAEMGNTNEHEIMMRKAEIGIHYPLGWAFKPSTDVRDLVKAGALIAAAIDRILLELAESEDERVRKGIIELVKQSSEILNKKNQERMLAWLEKQASYTTIAETGDGGINALVTRELPTDSEQKPADKVESHFHVEKGKWYMCIKNNVGITKGNAYYGISDGYIIDDNGRKYNCKNWAVFQGYLRLWDITIDAKEGDVLSYVTDEEDLWIMIYRSLYEPYEGHVHYHALLINDNFSDEGTCCICIDNLKPATKEQRDTLLKAMADAGYTFDFENKKLKKTEPKSKENKGNIGGFSSNSKWSEEDEKTLNEIFSVAARASLRKSTLFGKSYDYIKWQNWLKSLRPQNHWKPSKEQMQALLSKEEGWPPRQKVLESLYNDLKKLKEKV